MKSRNGKPVLPTPLCGCTGKIRTWFRRCHGTAVCCDVSEGNDCWQINDEKNRR